MSSVQSAQQETWRVILVGRTGLDQILRRDGSIELIRARDAVDALGELSDPIDQGSPARAAVLVSVSAEPQENEIGGFVDGLRLIDPDVRVLRVGPPVGRSIGSYDGSVNSNASLPEILEAIERAESTGKADGLRFVEPALEDPSPEDPAPQDPIQEEPIQEEPVQKDPVQKDPEVVVVARNEDFEHPAQGAFEEECAIHKQVLIGTAHEPPPIDPSSRVSKAAVSDLGSGLDTDQALVQAMLTGHSILDVAIGQINARLGRDDLRFVDESDAPGMPVMVGGHVVGKLVCDDQSWAMDDGHGVLQTQAQWLSAWIRLEIQQTELRKAAFTDSLTGSWNRRYFARYLDAAVVQARGARQPLTVMLFDIDDFKHYNDTYGHSAGDEILVETVKLLKSVIRPSDRVCRVGGDEFAVIFYEPNGPRDPSSKPLESVYQIATRFQRQICKHRFPKLADEALGTLTVSAGLASFPWDGHDSQSLLERADQLAIESKNNGKNAITLGQGAESVCKTNH